MSKSDNYPVGATLMFAGYLPENGTWLLCDGRTFNVQDYPELFQAIGYTYTPDGDKTLFSIPNYLGQFLRGASYTAPADPDKETRQTHNADAGPEGVGSKQGYATKMPPGDKPFQAVFNHLPTDYKNTHGVTRPGNTGFDGSASIQQQTCTGGGDKESRPKNVYLNFYIKSKN